MSTHGSYTTIDGRPAVRFERRLAHPIDRVWRAISDPAELRHWFPDTLEGEIAPGAPLRFVAPGIRFEGRVLAYDPPRRLHLAWGTGEIRLDLEPDGDACRLRLVNLLDAEDEAARNAAGWEVCLADLGAWLDGTTADADWRAHYDAYVDGGVPSGAAVPEDTD